MNKRMDPAMTVALIDILNQATGAQLEKTRIESDLPDHGREDPKTKKFNRQSARSRMINRKIRNKKKRSSSHHKRK